jgi:hypothetical protein
LAVVALTVLASCFTGPINRSPDKPSIVAEGTVMRGEAATFDILPRDPDGDPVTVSWTELPTCPADPSSHDWTGELQALPATVPAAATLEPSFCVCGVVVDSHNASSADCKEFWPQNAAPQAHLAVVAPTGGDPYPLFSDIQLSGQDSFDLADELTYSWALASKPPASLATDHPCAGDASHPSQRCFTADQPGSYTVSLTVTDVPGATDTASLTLRVAEDQPPCIRLSNPDYLVPLVLRNPDPTNSNLLVPDFEIVRVDDDGAPYPPRNHGSTRFSWSVGHGDLPLVDQNHDFPRLTVAPNTFSAGERGRVRVEIHDINADSNRLIDTTFSMCGDDKAQCGSAPGCLQRVTWTVQY